MKIDLHCHTKHSGKPHEWVLKKLGCPESFTEPLHLYQSAMQKGMTHVTVTDHDAIGGALEIAHFPNTFISEEVTTYFPEYQSKQHVLVYNITEEQHRQIQKLSENIYDLVGYLHREKIFHAIAHPLFTVHGKLTYDRFEKILLLFKVLELNGSRNEELNLALLKIGDLLTPKGMLHLADKHRLKPLHEEPWKKFFIGGSDDHSAITLASRSTLVKNAQSVGDFFAGVLEGKATVAGRHASPHSFSRNLYGIGYQYYKNKLHIHSERNPSSIFNVLDHFLTAENQVKSRVSFRARMDFMWRKIRRKKKKPKHGSPFISVLKEEIRDMVQNEPRVKEFLSVSPGNFEAMDRNWFEFVNMLANRLLGRFNQHSLTGFSGANFPELFHSLSSIGMLYSALAPVIVSFSLFSKDIAFSRNMIERFQKHSSEEKKPLKVAHFTDTLYEVNGVAQTLRRQAETAVRAGKDYTVLTCDHENRADRSGIKHFQPLGTFRFEEYRDQIFFIPPFFEMLNYCYEHKFTHIHSSTPGPIGLVALAIARILNLPFVGTYHTAFPEYMRYLTNDRSAEKIMWKLMLWYYKRMDCVFVPSRSTARDLIRKGLEPSRVRIYPRGVDIDEFHPSKKDAAWKLKYNIPEGLKILYVGRVSKEKNLHLLAEAFKSLSRKHPLLHLVVVGTGPYWEEMKKDLAGFPCIFTGSLKGEDLAAAYASCDLFVFPSTTDTFGNVVLEAQACGTPVIATDAGGPQENLIPGKTGLIVKADDVRSLEEGIASLLLDPEKLGRMRSAARQYMENRSFEKAFLQFWTMYDDIAERDDEQSRELQDDEIEKILARISIPSISPSSFSE